MPDLGWALCILGCQGGILALQNPHGLGEDRSTNQRQQCDGCDHYNNRSNSITSTRANTKFHNPKAGTMTLTRQGKRGKGFCSKSQGLVNDGAWMGILVWFGTPHCQPLWPELTDTLEARSPGVVEAFGGNDPQKNGEPLQFLKQDSTQQSGSLEIRERQNRAVTFPP